MPFINIGHKKRRLDSQSRGHWVLTPALKRQNLIQSHKYLDGPLIAGTTANDAVAIQIKSTGLRARLQRSGSRLKSLFGSSRQSIAPTIASQQENESTKDHTTTLVDPEACRSASSTSSTVIRSPKTTAEAQTEPFMMTRQSSSLRKSQSTPSLSHRLSHKLSSTFGNPTIVHKSELQSRPSIQSLNMLPRLHTGQHTGGYHCPECQYLNTSPTSTYLSGSCSSPNTVSTSPTSEGTIVMTGPYCKLNFPDVAGSRLNTIQEAPQIPSIVTVEATATAKIFFETHFDKLTMDASPRTQRLEDLENKLLRLNLSIDAHEQARQLWAQQESEYLRQDRVLKAKTYAAKAKGISVAGYQVVKVLGKGSFGVVKLVRARQTPVGSEDVTESSHVPDAYKASVKGLIVNFRKKSQRPRIKQVYAMKVIRKSDMLKNTQEGHLRAERDFLVASEGSRWVVPLIAAFQDVKNLYLVMEYCVGGDFLGLLIRKNVLSESVTKWYIAEMILCVEEAHRLLWIHRDVKPDNFLIGADGHLKISDFGLAFDGHWEHDQSFFHKHRHTLLEKLGLELQGDQQDQEEEQGNEAASRIGKALKDSTIPLLSPQKKQSSGSGPSPGETIIDWRNRKQRKRLAKSVVGTSQYMAPEVVRGDLYDGRCDWWSIGIIMYECIYGYTPFVCENRQETKLKILKHAEILDFPQKVKYRRHGKDHVCQISQDAVDLTWRLLQEKENRLCSKKYMLNDFKVQPTSSSGLKVFAFADKSSKNYAGMFVYENDAEELKKHVFFHGIPWDQLHLQRPPFVPNVSDMEDTKYFDEEDAVTAESSSSSNEEEQEEQEVLAHCNENVLPSATPHNTDEYVIPRVSHHKEDQKIMPSAKYEGKATNDIVAEDKKSANPLSLPQPRYDGEDAVNLAMQGIKPIKPPKKEKKRPRDKILRDHANAKTALIMRKKGAFLGYEYRRSKGADAVLEKLSAQGFIHNASTEQVDGAGPSGYLNKLRSHIGAPHAEL